MSGSHASDMEAKKKRLEELQARRSQASVSSRPESRHVRRVTPVSAEINPRSLLTTPGQHDASPGPSSRPGSRANIVRSPDLRGTDPSRPRSSLTPRRPPTRTDGRESERRSAVDRERLAERRHDMLDRTREKHDMLDRAREKHDMLDRAREKHDMLDRAREKHDMLDRTREKHDVLNNRERALDRGDRIDRNERRNPVQGAGEPKAKPILYTRAVQTDEIRRESRSLTPPPPESPTQSIQDYEPSEDGKPSVRRATSVEETQIRLSQDFNTFLNRASHIVKRELYDPFDVLEDFMKEGVKPEQVTDKVQHHTTFFDDSVKGRTVVSADWNPAYAELVAVGYGANEDPDFMQSLVYVWNLHRPLKPEFVMTTETDITCLTWIDAHRVAAGTSAGAILIWDTRADRSEPVSMTRLSLDGHMYPVFSLEAFSMLDLDIKDAKNKLIVSVSGDGTLCKWSSNLLARPQTSAKLEAPKEKTASVIDKPVPLCVTCAQMGTKNSSVALIASQNGVVYTGFIYDDELRESSIPGNSPQYISHRGPILGLHCNSARRPIFSDKVTVFATAGTDWTVCIWKTPGPIDVLPSHQMDLFRRDPFCKVENGVPRVAPVLVLDAYDNYVADVRWHPVHPGMLATVDASGMLAIWDLTATTYEPFATLSVSEAPLNIVRWSSLAPERLAVGGIDGRVHVYNLGWDVRVDDSAYDAMRSLCKM